MTSKTSIPCDCGFLQRSSENADMPLGFDPELNEFYVTYIVPGAGEGRLRVRHCPWCGGKAPESRRGLHFATIPDSEMTRLFALTEPLKTLADVLGALGEPEDDTPQGLIVETPAKDGSPATSQALRTLTYTRLSDTADLQIHLAKHPSEEIRVTLQGKYIGGAGY